MRITDFAENEVILEVNRNSLYLMSGDVAQADYLAASVNSYIARNGASDAFAVADSMLYIRQVNITRGMDVDIRIYVTQSALDDIFVYLAPNPDNVSTSSENRNEEFFFEITTESDTIFDALERAELIVSHTSAYPSGMGMYVLFIEFSSELYFAFSAAAQ